MYKRRSVHLHANPRYHVSQEVTRKSVQTTIGLDTSDVAYDFRVEVPRYPILSNMKMCSQHSMVRMFYE